MAIFFKEEVAKNGNSDLFDIPNYEDPGLEKLMQYLSVVKSSWFEVPMENYKHIIPCGIPPSNITKEQWDEIKDRATYRQVIIEEKIPFCWLFVVVSDMNFKYPFLLEKIRNAEEKKIGSINEIWKYVVQLYNGWLQVLQELNLYAKDEDGNPKEFCYEFFENEKTRVDPFDEKMLTIQKIADAEKMHEEEEDGEGDNGDYSDSE